ncbi:MAG: 4-demethylwyosine synthase TYW1 [Candidatus Bathyarchaeota archaeon]|nr:4-demethylwyosine synthase TYW1 [Candidatus Bathyarchaeota archaeon]
MSLPEEFRAGYVKQKYGLVGEHSAVKTCHWQRRSLTSGGEENCYKHRFYGIPTHRCLQMTPSLGHCTQSCVFCWRATPETLGVSWEQTRPIQRPEDPEAIIMGCLEAHKKHMTGFGGNPNVKKEMWREANDPIHAAISLEGEPTLYPRLGDLVEGFKDHGFKSVFIVTNGTAPEVLRNLSHEPTQLYVSLCAPDEETYVKTCRPNIPNAWGKVLETLELLESFSCPTVLRHTLIPKLNMSNPEGYAKLGELSNATYMEPKAAMSVGAARERFGYRDMAWFEEIQKFAEEIAAASSYNVLDEHGFSNIVLLSRLAKPIKLY